jgi:hypothetical protein
MTETRQIACIGAGYWGQNLIRNFSDLGVLSWACDLDSISGSISEYVSASEIH